MTTTTTEQALPPLPKPIYGPYYSAEEVREYALAALAATQSAQNSQVDWLGLALDLEQQAKRVESQTVERSMLSAAHGLRLMGAAQSAQPQEPIAWQFKKLSGKWFECSKEEAEWYRKHQPETEVRDLYAAPVAQAAQEEAAKPPATRLVSIIAAMNGWDMPGGLPEDVKAAALSVADKAQKAREPQVVTAWPKGYAAKHVEGHGWIIDPPQGSRWIAYEGTPAGDFMAAITDEQPKGELTDEQILKMAAKNGFGWAGDGEITPFDKDEDSAKYVLEFASALLSAQPTAQDSDTQDAKRWRETLKHIGGMHTDTGAQRFTLRYLSPVAGANIMQGSVAEHFTNAIDAAIEQEKNK